MIARPLTLNVPDVIYDHIERRAASAGRTVEAEALDLIAATLPTDDLDPQWESMRAQLDLLDDDLLWQVARSRLPASTVKRLTTLNRKDGREGLTATERQLREQLLRRYDRVMLLRAQAAVILKRRGCDIADLITEP